MAGGRYTNLSCTEMPDNTQIAKFTSSENGNSASIDVTELPNGQTNIKLDASLKQPDGHILNTTSKNETVLNTGTKSDDLSGIAVNLTESCNKMGSHFKFPKSFSP